MKIAIKHSNCNGYRHIWQHGATLNKNIILYNKARQGRIMKNDETLKIKGLYFTSLM